MITTLTAAFLMMSFGLVYSALAQSNDASSILEKAQESLNSHTSVTNPTMIVNSQCNTTNSGVYINMNTAGFEANTLLKWKLEESRSGGYTPASGTFGTNATGGFHESVFVKGLSDGEYSVIFGKPSIFSVPNFTKIVISCNISPNRTPSDVSINATLKEGDYIESNLYFQNSTIYFGGNSTLCPDSHCAMELQDTTFNQIGQERYFTGTLKVEDKANSDEHFTAYKFYKLDRGSFSLTSSKENPTGDKILFYTGTFGIIKGNDYVPTWKFESDVQLAGNNLMLKGKATE